MKNFVREDIEVNMNENVSYLNEDEVDTRKQYATDIQHILLTDSSLKIKDIQQYNRLPCYFNLQLRNGKDWPVGDILSRLTSSTGDFRAVVFIPLFTPYAAMALNMPIWRQTI